MTKSQWMSLPAVLVLPSTALAHHGGPHLDSPADVAYLLMMLGVLMTTAAPMFLSRRSMQKKTEKTPQETLEEAGAKVLKPAQGGVS